MRRSAHRHPLRPSLSAVAFIGAALLFARPALAQQAAESLKGFGNIPFGTSSDDALRLNNGNGTMTKGTDRTAILVYKVVVAGLDFQVSQNFDPNGRATKATLNYSSLEQPNACIGRFDYVLNLLTQQYGKPSSAPAARREDIGETSHDHYAFEYAMKDNSAIKAQLEVSYPKQRPSEAKSGGAAAKAQQTPPGCRIALDYLPPGWVSHL